jgi:hypothetical protein
MSYTGNIIHNEMHIHTNSIEQGPLSDAGEEIIRLLRNPNIIIIIIIIGGAVLSP